MRLFPTLSFICFGSTTFLVSTTTANTEFLTEAEFTTEVNKDDNKGSHKQTFGTLRGPNNGYYIRGSFKKPAVANTRLLLHDEMIERREEEMATVLNKLLTTTNMDPEKDTTAFARHLHDVVEVTNTTLALFLQEIEEQNEDALLLLLPGFIKRRLRAIMVIAFLLHLYKAKEYDWFRFALLFFAPDLTILAFVLGQTIGNLLYNTSHSKVIAFLYSLKGHLNDSDKAIANSIIWLTHIFMDISIWDGHPPLPREQLLIMLSSILETRNITLERPEEDGRRLLADKMTTTALDSFSHDDDNDDLLTFLLSIEMMVLKVVDLLSTRVFDEGHDDEILSKQQDRLVKELRETFVAFLEEISSNRNMPPSTR